MMDGCQVATDKYCPLARSTLPLYPGKPSLPNSPSRAYQDAFPALGPTGQVTPREVKSEWTKDVPSSQAKNFLERDITR